MKTTLRQGDASTLNIYSVNYDGSYLGWAMLPQWYAGWPHLDGVVIVEETVPGGTLWSYNEGIVLVHEVGTFNAST